MGISSTMRSSVIVKASLDRKKMLSLMHLLGTLMFQNPWTGLQLKIPTKNYVVD